MIFQVRDVLVPLEPGHAVDRGWPAASGGRPHGVTWHWTATWDLAECRRLLGGATPERKGTASAHYAVGRTFAEGVDRYVELDNRSWHAGKEQTLCFDGRPFAGPDDKGARTTVGVETVAIGPARDGVPAGDDWIVAATPEGEELVVQPWTDEQVEMMIAVGREIVDRFPHVGPRHHHGHADLCPGYKVDPVGFPYARVLRGIYADPSLPDVWTPLQTLAGRRRVLAALGYDAGDLRRFQADHGLVPDGFWTSFVNWRVAELLDERGLDLASVAAERAPGRHGVVDSDDGAPT